MVQKGIDKRKEEDLIKGKHCDESIILSGPALPGTVVLQHSLRQTRTMMGFSQWKNT